MSAYAHPVMEPTQGAPDPGAAGDRPRLVSAGEGSLEPTSAPELADDDRGPDALAIEAAAREEQLLAARAAAVRAAEAAGGSARAGLLRWTAVVFGGAFASVLAGRPDLALFLMFAALFALTQSWDARERSHTGDPYADALLEPSGVGRALRLLVPLMLPLIGAVGYLGLATWALTMPATPAHTAASYWGFAAAGICMLMMLPAVSQSFASLLVRSPARSYTARLTASLAILALLLPVPMRLMFDEMLPLLTTSDRALVDVPGLVGQLLGEAVFALAAVGLWVSRTPRETWTRLGLGPMGPREWMVAVVGLIAVSGLNASLEWAERAWLPELWRQDQAMGEMIARDISLTTALVLGLSAGVGEEVLLRGALQPRTGLMWASLLFAVAHVQYTWFGMLVIFLLGVTLGLVRKHTNTTTAIVVHGVYDIFAAFSMAR